MTNRAELREVCEVIRWAQERFRARMLGLAEGISSEDELRRIYVRYLSMQYHLTKGVQRPFFAAAAHPELAARPELRAFVLGFAQEEEGHFEVAARDLRELGESPARIPFDVELWWAYFERVTPEQPFLRLGASCVLENIAATTRGMFSLLESGASFLNVKNTVFFKAHQHDGAAPHGDELLDVLARAALTPAQLSELREGAEKGAVFYLRMVAEALSGKSGLDEAI